MLAFRETCMQCISDNACNHTYIHAYVHTFIHVDWGLLTIVRCCVTYIHSFMYACTHAYIHATIQLCMHICTYIRTYMHACIQHSHRDKCTCECTQADMRTCRRARTCTRTHPHAYKGMHTKKRYLEMHACMLPSVKDLMSLGGC